MTKSGGVCTIPLGAGVTELGSCIGEDTDFCATVKVTSPARFGDTTTPTEDLEVANDAMVEGQLKGSASADGHLNIVSTSNTDIGRIIIDDHVTTVGEIETGISIPLASGVDFTTNVSSFLGIEIGSAGGTPIVWDFNTADSAASFQGSQGLSFRPTVRLTDFDASPTTGAFGVISGDPIFELNASSGTPAAVVTSWRPMNDSASCRRTPTSGTAGTIVVTEWTSLYSQPGGNTSTDANCTLTTRRGVYYRDRAGSATQTTSITVDAENQTATNAHFLRSAGEDDTSLIAGDVRIGCATTGTCTPAAPAAKLHVQEPTIGNDVLNLESVATNDDPNFRVVQARAATTDATVTTLLSTALTSGQVYLLEARVVAHCTGGASCTANNGAGYVVYATAKNNGGTSALIGAASATHTGENVAGWDATIDVDDTTDTARVRVTGAGTTTITWHATVTIQNVGT